MIRWDVSGRQCPCILSLFSTRTVLALGLCLLPQPATAFVLSTVEYDRRVQHPRWHGSAPQVTFVMNDRSLDLLPNLDRASTPVLAIEGALKSWVLGPVGLSYGGTVMTTDVGEDGDNLITFADTPQNRDAVGNATAVAIFAWSVRSGNQLRIHEADIVVSARDRFATNGGAGHVDLQGVLTHELGHALGLEHSGNVAATMYAYTTVEEISGRSLEADDIAGLLTLYGAGSAPTSGAIQGQVVTVSDSPVFGGYVTAVDGDGIPQVGALTDRQGNFTIPALPAGLYHVYAEPLDGPVWPEHLNDTYFHDRQHPLLTRFHTTFAGGNAAPASVRVEAGQTTSIDPIHVQTQTPALNLSSYLWTTDWRTWKAGPAPMQPGRATNLLVSGPGMATWPAGGFNVSGSGVGIDDSQTDRGTLQDGVPYILFTLWSSYAARPGPRNLMFTSGIERTVMTGLIQVGSN